MICICPAVTVDQGQNVLDAVGQDQTDIRVVVTRSLCAVLFFFAAFEQSAQVIETMHLVEQTAMVVLTVGIRVNVIYILLGVFQCCLQFA